MGSVIAGGDFWRGAKQGAIVAVYNHAVHSIAKNFSQTKGPGDEEQQQEQQSSDIKLKFDGQKIYVIKDGEIVNSFPAVSGKLGKDGSFDYSVDRQQMKNVGPIPEGNYLINSNNTQKWSDLSFSQKTFALFRRGRFPGGTIAWGSERVDIKPLDDTNVYGRSGFTIHGGSVPGSAGCIDLTTFDKSFFSLIRNRGLIKLTVGY